MKVTLCGLLIAFCIRVRLYGRSCVLFCSLIFVNGLLVLKRVSNGLNAQVKTSNVEANSIQFNSIQFMQVLKQCESPCLFLAMACVNLVFLPTEKSRFFQLCKNYCGFCSKSVRQKCLNKWDLRRINESLFIVELKTLLNVLQRRNCFGEFSY